MNTIRTQLGVMVLLMQLLSAPPRCPADEIARMSNELAVKIEGIAAIPVQVSVDYFNVADSGWSNLGFGTKVYYIGSDGTVILKNLSNAYDGIRVQVRNPTQRKLAVVAYDGQKKIAGKESTTRGETLTLDIGRCAKQNTPAKLTDFSLAVEDQSRVDSILQLFKTEETSQMNHHEDSLPGLAKGIAQHIRETLGKVKVSDRADWIRVELNGGKNREVVGVVDFENGSLVAGTRIQADGTELLRIWWAGSVKKAYQSNPVKSALEQWAVKLSKDVFDESAAYPMNRKSDAEFNAGLRQDFGTHLTTVSVHKTTWVDATKSNPIQLHVETKIQTESTTYYLVHVIELDPHRLSSFAYLFRRSYSAKPSLK